MGLTASPGRRKLAVIAAWAGIVGMVLGVVHGAYWLAETIRTNDRVGIGVCLPLGGLLVICLGTWGAVSWAKLTALYRRSARVFGPAQPYVVYRPAHLIEVHEPWLERLMQDTRSILHEMSHLEAEAEWWPSDGLSTSWLGRRRSRMSASLGNSLADFTTVNRVTRDVWEWVRTVEALPLESRSYLEARGVEVEKLRATLLADSDFHGRFLAMGRLLRRYEEVLFALPPDPFRGVGASPCSDTASRQRTAPSPRLSSTQDAGRQESDQPPIEQVYSKLVDTRQRALRRLAAKFARTAEDREDLYQDMLLAIWKALPNFRGEASLATYAQRIAHSTAVDYVRRRRITAPEIDAEDRNASPEERVGMALAGASIQAAVDKLPKILRDVMVLHLEGHDYEEIARRMGIRQSNVGARLTRARDRLRRRLCGVTPRSCH